jgi:adenosylcobinamide-GDP ribazoletransferase
VKRQLVLLGVAMQFLTRLPVPPMARFEPRWLTESVRYFPLVGTLVGTLLALLCAGLLQVLPRVVAVGVMLGASLLLTGAFHEDGFADACDGFGGGTSREQVLAIMKDSRLGAYGAMGLVMLLGLKWAALVSVPNAVLPPLLVGAHMWSRWCAIGLIWRLPYVRDDDSAKSRPVAAALSGGGWAVSGMVGLLAFGLVAKIALMLGYRLEARAMAAAALAAAAAMLPVAALFRRRIGGYTGDCLGAAQQIAELTFLVTGLAVLGDAPP